jgi:hypothetical protein
MEYDGVAADNSKHAALKASKWGHRLNSQYPRIIIKGSSLKQKKSANSLMQIVANSFLEHGVFIVAVWLR